jgi:hypothetical protein
MNNQHESRRLIQIQTFATKKIQPTELCICVDIYLCLNRKSITHSRRKPMTILVHAQSKLSENYKQNNTGKAQQRSCLPEESPPEDALQPSNTNCLQSPPAPPDTANYQFVAITRSPTHKTI